MRGARKFQDEVEKITFRLFPPYTSKVAEQARIAKLNPNQFARIATMSVSDTGFLDLSNRLQRIEEELLGLRKDFNSAVETGND